MNLDLLETDLKLRKSKIFKILSKYGIKNEQKNSRKRKISIFKMDQEKFGLKMALARLGSKSDHLSYFQEQNLKPR